MMIGAAVPEERMTYDFTKDKFLQFPFSVHECPVFGSERSDFGSKRPDLES